MPAATAPVEGVYEKTLGSGVWYVRYRVNGKLVRKAIGKRQAAIDYHRKVKVLLRSGEGSVPNTAKGTPKTDKQIAVASSASSGGISISELCDDLLRHIVDDPEAYRDQSNPPRRIEVIRREFGSREAAGVKPTEFKNWLHASPGKAATKNKMKSTISAIYRLGIENSKVQSNPAREFKPRPVGKGIIRYLRPDEEDRLRAVLEEQLRNQGKQWQYEEADVRHRICELDIALGTGMRKGEQYGLKWRDVDLKNYEITLRDTKNGNPRIVFMIDDVVEAFEALRSLAVNRNDGKAPDADDRVFAVVGNKKWWESALKKAEVTEFRWHDLRHTFCSRLVQSGVNLKVIQRAAGHKTIEMTARYAHTDETKERDALAVLNRKKSS